MRENITNVISSLIGWSSAMDGKQPKHSSSTSSIEVSVGQGLFTNTLCQDIKNYTTHTSCNGHHIEIAHHDTDRHQQNGPSFQQSSSGGWFNIKMSSYQYMKSHCGDTGKTTSLYWIRALVCLEQSNIAASHDKTGDPICDVRWLSEYR